RSSATFVVVRITLLCPTSGEVNQTSYPVAPSTGVQRISPGRSGVRCSATAPGPMLNPNGALHRVVPRTVLARTRTYSAYGSPVIHGRAIGTVTAGTLSGPGREVVDQTIVRSSKVLLVASWNS